MYAGACMILHEFNDFSVKNKFDISEKLVDVWSRLSKLGSDLSSNPRTTCSELFGFSRQKVVKVSLIILCFRSVVYVIFSWTMIGEIKQPAVLWSRILEITIMLDMIMMFVQVMNYENAFYIMYLKNFLIT